MTKAMMKTATSRFYDESAAERWAQARPLHGWLVVDKAPGPTSAQVVGRLRRLTGADKVGHGGTLDPMAGGVLPIAFGGATKTVAHVMASEKVYRFTVRWGEARDTDDAEGAVTETSPVRPSPDEIAAALGRFTGEIEQVPPDYSAIKVRGRRAYDLARQAQAVTLPARRVTVRSLSLISADDPDHCTLALACGKGTYVRALVRDLARALGTVGHVAALRRTRVGTFSEEDGVTIAEIEDAADKRAVVHARLLPVDTALGHMPALSVDAGQAARLGNGQKIPLLRLPEGETAADGEIRVHFAGRLLAIARLKGSELQPVRVFKY